MRKKLFIVIACLSFCFFGMPVFATSFTADRSAWEGAVGTFYDVDLSGYALGSTISAGDSVLLPESYGSVAFDDSLGVEQVGSGWLTWSGGLTPIVLTTDLSSVTGSFAPGVFNFGLEMEPDDFDAFTMTLTLSDGSSLFQSVEGDSGAKFFGFLSDVSIASIEMSTSVDAGGFAFGRMVVGGESAAAPVPEPGTLLLLGSGLIGLAYIKRRKS